VDIGRLVLELDFPADDARDIQQIVDQPRFGGDVTPNQLVNRGQLFG